MGTPPRDVLPDLRRRLVEQRDRLEPVSREARVVGQRLAEVAGADHRHVRSARRGRGSAAGGRPAPRPSTRRRARRTRRTTRGPCESARRSGGTGRPAPATTRCAHRAPRAGRGSAGRSRDGWWSARRPARRSGAASLLVSRRFSIVRNGSAGRQGMLRFALMNTAIFQTSPIRADSARSSPPDSNDDRVHLAGAPARPRDVRRARRGQRVPRACGPA